MRSAMYAAMKIMGKQFVLGRDMKEALKASRKSREKGYTTPTTCWESPP